LIFIFATLWGDVCGVGRKCGFILFFAKKYEAIKKKSKKKGKKISSRKKKAKKT
jgi:hypothetical protein